MRVTIYTLVADLRHSRVVSTHASPEAANAQAAALVSFLATEHGCDDDVTSTNWRSVMNQLVYEPFFTVASVSVHETVTEMPVEGDFVNMEVAA